MSRRVPGLLLALAAAPLALTAQGVTVSAAGDLSSLVGMPFDMPVVADWSARADKLGSFALTLRWDPAVLRFETGTAGSFGALQVNRDSAAQGVLKLAGANPAGASGVITLGIARFTPLAANISSMALALGDIYSASPGFTDVSSQTTLQPGLFCPARGFWGDPDGDRTVGSRDALIALSEAVGLDVSAFPEHGLSDVDADGSVKARDALIMLSHAVGLDVSAYRVDRIAVGSCGSEQTTTYAVTPGGDTLVGGGGGGRGESVQFELRATAAGVVRTLPDVFWSTSDPNVLAVQPDGRGVTVGPGTVTVIGKSGDRDSATATLVVRPRRSRHYVDALAAAAVNQLGSTAHPYATLAQASAVTLEGDTVIVQPGRYDDPATFTSGVLIQGLSGGTNGVVLTSGDGYSNAALTFSAGARAEVRNVTVDRVAIGLAAIGVDTLVVDSLHYFEGASQCGDDGIATSDIYRLEVRRSVLRGAGATQGCGGGISVNGAARLLLVEDTQLSDFYADAIYAGALDSAVVRRSVIHDNYGYAVDVGAGRSGFGVVPVPVSTGLLIEDSQFAANTGGGVYASPLRSGLVTRTTIASPQANGIYLTGTSGADAFAIVADTFSGAGNYWLTSYALDTLRIDSTLVTATQGGYGDHVVDLRLTRSRFDNAQDGTILSVTGNDTVASHVSVDSVAMSGDLACTQCAYGLETYSAVASVQHFTGDNLSDAVDLYDSTSSVTHSTITNSQYGVYMSGPSFAAAVPRGLVRGVTMDNVTYAVEGDYIALFADSLTLSRGSYGVYTYPGFGGASGADTVEHSTISDYQYGLYLSDTTQVALGNQIVRPGFIGVEMAGFATAADSAIVTGNTITCDATGANNAAAIQGSGSNFRIEGNTDQGCYQGVSVSGGSGANTASIRGNSFSAPAYYGTGVVVNAPMRAIVAGNVSTSSGANGAIQVSGYSFQHIPFARVDSNTIRGARDRGIFLSEADTVSARGNLIDTVAVVSFTNGAQGIALSSDAGVSAAISGNTVRGVQGNGIYVEQTGALLVSVDSNGISGSDTAAVRVDAGSITARGNNVRNNHQYGIWIASCCGPHEIHQNAFQGNAVDAVASTAAATVNADSNWWGADGVPPGGLGADAALNVVDNGPLSAAPAALPPLSPPAPLLVAATGLASPSRPSIQVAAARPAPVAPALRLHFALKDRTEQRRPTVFASRPGSRPPLPAALASLRRNEAARAAQAADVAARRAAWVAEIEARNARRTQ